MSALGGDGDNVEMEGYTNPTFASMKQSNLYVTDGSKKRAPQETSMTVKMLIVACIVNFVLLVASTAALSFFVTRNATYMEANTTPTMAPTGVVGSQMGVMGPPGPAGQPGTTGQSGEKGEAGEVGQPGVDGPPGIQGPPGNKGAAGLMGLQGMKGVRGDTGSTGDIGPIGMKGDTGSSGPKGATGTAGTMGTTGAPGMKGDMGLIGLPGPPPAVVGGVTYTRWGNTACPTGANLVYSGRVGATASIWQGGAANHVCMPENPLYALAFIPGAQGYSWMYGTQYEFTAVPGRNLQSATCAVCYVATRHTTIMIPATILCPTGWTREYSGFLMSEARLHQRTTFECVDNSMEVVPGTTANNPGGHFYHVEADCTGLACPPYNNERELNCVVCSI